MEKNEYNSKNYKLLKPNKTSKNSPINKSPTLVVPYNRKKIGNIKKIIDISTAKGNNSSITQRNFSNSINSSYKTNINLDRNKYNKEINNKVINININYNDKYNYFGNYDSNTKNKKEILGIDRLNYNIEDKNLKLNKNEFLEINLNNMNSSKNKIKNYTSNNTITPAPQDSFFNNKANNKRKNSNKIKKIKDKKGLNSLNKINDSNNNINNKIKIIETINNKNAIKNENNLVRNILNITKNKNIILFLNKKNKVESKRKGLFLLNKFILDESNAELIINNINEIFMFIYFELNYFQEKNIILLIEGLTCILHLFECFMNKNNLKNFYFENKNFIEIIIYNFNEKITNIKIKNIFFKLLYIFFNLYSIADVLNILIKNLSKVINNEEIIKHYLLFIKNILEKNKNNIKNINLKSLLNFIIQVEDINNNYHEIKLLSAKIICVLYKIYGKIIKDYIKSKNESFFYIIENEINKNEKEKNNINELNTKITNKIGQSKSFMIKNKINFNNKIRKLNTNNNFRKDIGKEITPKLLLQLSSGDFISKKNGIDFINNLIKKYKNISIKGLKDLFLLIKDKLSNDETNSACLILNLLSNLIIALGPQIKIYSNILIYPLLMNLSNISQEVRELSFDCIEKWIKIQGFNVVSAYIPELLNNKNINIKSEILKLILNNYSLIDIDNNKNFYQNLNKPLINCLINKSMIIRNYTEKLIKKLSNILQKDSYKEEINKSNFEKKEKEYLLKKIDNLFSAIKYNYNGNINKIIISNINKSHKQNNFNHKQLRFLSEVSSDNENTNNFPKKNLSRIKQKILETRNKTTCSNNSLSALNLNSYTLPLNRSTGQLNKNRNKNSIIINDKTLNSILKNIRNKSPNYSNTNLSSNRISTHSSLPIRKKTENNTINKLIFSSIILPSKIQKKMHFEEKYKLLPDEAKIEIKKLKTMQNINNKKLNYKKINRSEKKKKLSCILNINNNFKHRRNYLSQVLETDFSKNRKQLFKEFNEFYIFSPNYNSDNLKKEKQLRYENDKKVNFDIQEIQDLKDPGYIENISKNIFSSYFIQNIFNQNIERIIFCITQFNKLLETYILNHDKNNIDKIIDNLDILLKIFSFQINKYNDDSLTKIFFIFLYSIIKLSKSINYYFNETEITILLNILCNKLNNNNKIIAETTYNLIFYLNNQCDNKTFIVILSRLLKHNDYKIIPEIIKIIQNLCEKSKYNKEIVSLIVEDITKIYFYNFYKYDYIKNEFILPLLKNIFNSIGNTFWEKCLFLSKEKKEILSNNLFNLNKKFRDHDVDDDEIDKNLMIKNIIENKRANNKNKFNNYKSEIINNKSTNKKYRKINIISNIKENNNFVIRRNKTSENMKFFQASNDKLSKYSYNNISFDLDNLTNEESEEIIVENKLLKLLDTLNSENVKEEIIINSILTIYNLVYKNYNKYKNIFLNNIDTIIDMFIKIIQILWKNLDKETKSINYTFNILYKLCNIENLVSQISFKIHQKLFLLLITLSTNKQFKLINEKNNDNSFGRENTIKNYKLIFKNINSIIIFIVNKMDITNNILILLNIIKNNRKSNIDIVENCISWLSVLIKNIKEKYIFIKENIIFNEIQILLNDLNHKKEKIENKTIKQTIIEVIKNLILEIINYKKDAILEYQNNIKDKSINKLIQNSLNDKNTINSKNIENESKKGFLFEGDTFYPKIK